ncbi:MAG: TetR/AcrR family transcriptional regulator [Methylomonas sp.]|jgi:AcrR family transcriptional regulator|uniref:TetR/AcrR family transcriptional regulator n=1 Tax=Methylomonas sp. TaxID=418 RepID=UPI0025D16C1F|nr:TetR/AcrR family transcriptional regulator [Methylomonas sp.]MCK9606916.1 TetR/AcrR family transcriptional regulator [Methylomonas sp.]
MSRNLQEHILQAASALFYRQGIKSTGVDAIVKAAGTTKMSLYKYFPSKDDLVLAHLRLSRTTTLAHIQSGIDSGGETPRQKLLAVIDVFDVMLETPEFRGCPFINAAAEFAEENNPVQIAAAEFYAEFRKLLAKLAEQAGSHNPEHLAAQLTLLIAGAIVGEQIRRNSGAIANARTAAAILIDYNLSNS